jgi:hypothetical protein
MAAVSHDVSSMLPVLAQARGPGGSELVPAAVRQAATVAVRGREDRWLCQLQANEIRCLEHQTAVLERQLWRCTIVLGSALAMSLGLALGLLLFFFLPHGPDRNQSAAAPARSVLAAGPANRAPEPALSALPARVELPAFSHRHAAPQAAPSGRAEGVRPELHGGAPIVAPAALAPGTTTPQKQARSTEPRPRQTALREALAAVKERLNRTAPAAAAP